MASVKEIQLNFYITSKAKRRVSLQILKNGLYALPGGQEVFIAPAVMQVMSGYDFGGLDQRFSKIMDCIDESGSDRPMVPVSRIGAGPTDKSARFSVQVIQKINNGLQGPVSDKKETTLTFTLPISQIETVGDDQMAAPLWLILEKLKDKVGSKWGAKSRSKNHVLSEFIPATLRATTSPRVSALKAWLTTMRDDLAREVEDNKNAADLLQIENEKIAEEFFQKYLSGDSTSSLKMKIHISSNYGSVASAVFQQKVTNFTKMQT